MTVMIATPLMAMLFVLAAVVGSAVGVAPEGANPANDLETFPRLKGTNQVAFHDFMRMMASSGAPSQLIGRIPAGGDAGKLTAALQQRAPIEEGKLCHIDVFVPQKVSGRCIALDGAPTCMAKDKMETNYRDCLGLNL